MEQITVNLLATGETPVCHASQFDDGRTIRINLKKGADVYTLSGTEEVKMRIRKPDKTERVVDIVNTSNSYVDYVSTPEDCDIAGVNVCELVIDDLGSKNFNMKVEEDAYGGGADIETLAASGPVATFETNMVDNLVDLKAEITPIQDLHGYDYPWPAGSGKNKCSMPNTTFEQFAEVEIDEIPIGSYVYSAVITSTDTDSDNCVIVFLDENKNTLVSKLLDRSVGNVRVSTSFSVSVPIKFVRLYAGSSYPAGAGDTASFVDNMICFQSASNPTVFEPYSNICPISGHDSVKLVRTGKNLTNISVLPYTIHWGTDAADLVQFLNTLPVGRYTISNKYKINEVPSSGKVLHGAFLIRALVNGEQINVTPYLLVTDNNPAVGKVYQESVSFEITEAIKGNINHAYRYCDQDNPHSGSGRGSYDCYDVQIETGSSVTDYEPYTGSEVTVTFGQTIYKGVLDAKNSKVIATHVLGNFDGSNDETWNDYPAGNGFFISGLSNHIKENYGDGLCNILPTSKSLGKLGVVYGINSYYIFIMQVKTAWNISTVSDLRTFLASNPLQIMYKLAEPIEIPLSAISQFETLLGVNNVYANTGDVDLKYLKQV